MSEFRARPRSAATSRPPARATGASQTIESIVEANVPTAEPPNACCSDAMSGPSTFANTLVRSNHANRANECASLAIKIPGCDGSVHTGSAARIYRNAGDP
jgi:hypothetical protein